MKLVARKLRSFHNARQLAAFLAIHYPTLQGATLPEIVARLSPARHSADFRSVKWYGTAYQFNATQSAIVHQLWQAWELGVPHVGAGRLLSASDMISDKVSEVFKTHPAWGTMVRTDNKGTYWLEEPVDSVEKPSKSA